MSKTLILHRGTGQGEGRYADGGPRHDYMARRGREHRPSGGPSSDWPSGSDDRLAIKLHHPVQRSTFEFIFPQFALRSWVEWVKWVEWVEWVEYQILLYYPVRGSSAEFVFPYFVFKTRDKGKAVTIMLHHPVRRSPFEIVFSYFAIISLVVHLPWHNCDFE